MTFLRVTVGVILVALSLPAVSWPAVSWSAPKIIENNFGDVTQGGSNELPAAPLTETPSDSSRVVGGPVIWSMPQVQERMVKLRLATALLFKQGRFADAEKVARKAVELVPHDAAGYYLLACTQAKQDKKDAALLSLSRAVDRGFDKSAEMSRDPNLKSLHDSLRFAELIAAARIAEKPPNPWMRKIRPDVVEDGVATVSAANTGWDAKHGLFISLFRLPPAAPTNEVVKGGPADKINTWYREGTAAGNHGDFYDNHDSKHSMAAVNNFPQLTQIRYGEDARKRNLHHGLQTQFLFNGIVMGNSSTALVNGPYWRSQPRLAYVSKRRASVLYLQYINNHVYCYPEHRDHDSGKGDVFPANTPYVFISQGSSGSDRAAMNAILYTLAAFRPEVKKFLAENQALMPTIQLIARYTHDNLEKPEDYLTGKAHPTVFNAGGFSADRMAESAHALTKETVPPLVKLNVVEDDDSQVGRDYFDIGPRQELFTTPCAIARVHRTTNYKYRMVVSAEESADLNGRDLTYHWKVLRGDADRIEINPLNEAGSVVELLVPFHPKQEIGHGSTLQSSRVDIGCFVNNGLFYSAPAFVTFYSLPNERRGYRADEKVAFVEYKDPASGGDYADPMIDVPKNWKDVYLYDDDGNLIGWTRQRDGAKEHFTADGAIILERDKFGRAKRAQTVRYKAERHSAKEPPVLQQVPGDEILHYAYASPDERRGRVVRRERVD